MSGRIRSLQGLDDGPLDGKLVKYSYSCGVSRCGGSLKHSSLDVKGFPTNQNHPKSIPNQIRILALYSLQCPLIEGRQQVAEHQGMVHAGEKIAIIGMGCRLPGDAASLESFWELLIQGRDSWSEVPPERWNASAYYHSSGERKGTVSRNTGKSLQELT